VVWACLSSIPGDFTYAAKWYGTSHSLATVKTDGGELLGIAGRGGLEFMRFG
jgi:hypothetical protein